MAPYFFQKHSNIEKIEKTIIILNQLIYKNIR
jgi:hypothetical protein